MVTEGEEEWLILDTRSKLIHLQKNSTYGSRIVVEDGTESQISEFARRLFLSNARSLTSMIA